MSFIAELSVPTNSAHRYIDAVCHELTKVEIENVRDDRGAVVSLQRGLGTARIDADADGIRVRAESTEERGISVLKFILGLRIEQAAAEEKLQLVWTGYGSDFVELPGLREITVAGIQDITPHMRRIRFAGRDMQRFCGKEIHIRLLFPPAGLAKPEWPKPGKNGRPEWPPEERRPATRIYTVRDFDAARNEIDVDFVLHGDHGIAGKWAANARPGDMIGLMGPGGGEAEKAQWQLLAGDETAIPALARKLQSLPEEARGVVLIEVADKAEEQIIATPPQMQINWLHRNGLEAGRNTLLADAVRAVSIPTDVEDRAFWLGAEAATARAMRTFWRDELGLPRARVTSVAYWHHEANKEPD